MSKEEEKPAVQGLTPEELRDLIRKGHGIGPRVRAHPGLQGEIWSRETMQKKLQEQRQQQAQQAQQLKPPPEPTPQEKDWQLVKSIVGTLFNVKVVNEVQNLPLERLLPLQRKLLEGKPTFRDTFKWTDEEYNRCLNILNALIIQKIATAEKKDKSILAKLLGH